MAEETIVLSDASPLIGLAAAGCFEVLRELFDTVHITESVRKEVTVRKHLPGAAETTRGIRSRWIRRLLDPRSRVAFPTLDAGEVTTLHAAVRFGPPSLVLLDDGAARAEARALGITVFIKHAPRTEDHPACALQCVRNSRFSSSQRSSGKKIRAP